MEYKGRGGLLLCLTPTSSQLLCASSSSQSPRPSAPPAPLTPQVSLLLFFTSSFLAWRLCGSSLCPCWSYWWYRGRAPRPSRLRSTCAALTWLTPFTWSVGTEASSTTPRETLTLCWVSSLLRRAELRRQVATARWPSTRSRTRWRCW